MGEAFAWGASDDQAAERSMTILRGAGKYGPAHRCGHISRGQPGSVQKNSGRAVKVSQLRSRLNARKAVKSQAAVLSA